MTFFNPRSIVSVVVALMLSVFANAQSACPDVNAGPDITMPCGVTCTMLRAKPVAIGATTSYTVSPIINNPITYNAGTQVLNDTDDWYTDAIDIPFNFCFFGGTYNKLVIGSNGIVSFDLNYAGRRNPYDVRDSAVIVSGIDSSVKTCIMAPWQDMDARYQGQIFYQVVGTAPCRQFVVSWYRSAMFGDPNSAWVIRDGNAEMCGGAKFQTSQVVMYETTNVIDINIENRDVCTGWQGGVATEGIVSNDGINKAYFVPGRNKQAFTAQNDAWRFTPSGNPIYVSRWYDAGNRLIGTGDSISVCNDTTLQATYKVETTYTPCDGSSPIVKSDDVKVSHTGTILLGIDSSTDVSCGGLSNGKACGHITGGGPNLGYHWVDANNTVVSSNPCATNLSTGTYYLTASDTPGCIWADTVTIGTSSVNTLAANPTHKDPLCFGFKNGSIDANPSGGTTGYTYAWENTTTTTLLPDQSRVIEGLGAGNYSVSVTDAQGCSVVATTTLSQPVALEIGNPVPSPVKCQGEKTGEIKVSPSGGVAPYNSSATQDYVTWFSADASGVIHGLSAGEWWVVVFDGKQCTKQTKVTVPDAISDEPQAFADSTSCYGPGYNDGAVSVVPNNANPPYQYSLDGGELQDANEFYNVSAGLHNVTMINGNGCVSKIPVTVPEPLPIIADVTPDSIVIPLGGSQQVEVTWLNANPLDVFFTWDPSLGISCTDCNNPVVSPYESGDYVVTVNYISHTEVCHGSTTLHVKVLPHLPVFIPNAFTPDGNFENEAFQVYGQGIKGVNLSVYNRWGEKVFETTSQFDGWNGTYQGQPVPPGVFTYRAIITFLDNEQVEKKGSVTLIR